MKAINAITQPTEYLEHSYNQTACRNLLARILLVAVQDAQKGDQESGVWLTGPVAVRYAAHLGIDEDAWTEHVEKLTEQK